VAQAALTGTVTGFDSTEPPTRPDATDSATALMLARLFDQLAPIDQRGLTKLVEAWFSANPADRIRIEDLAARLVEKR
jgi:hypothetical protein